MCFKKILSIHLENIIVIVRNHMFLAFCGLEPSSLGQVEIFLVVTYPENRNLLTTEVPSSKSSQNTTKEEINKYLSNLLGVCFLIPISFILSFFFSFVNILILHWFYNQKKTNFSMAVLNNTRSQKNCNMFSFYLICVGNIVCWRMFVIFETDINNWKCIVCYTFSIRIIFSLQRKKLHSQLQKKGKKVFICF